jgi:hypothetical protein
MSGARASPAVELQAAVRKAMTAAAARHSSTTATCGKGERGGECGGMWLVARHFGQGLQAMVEHASDRRRLGPALSGGRRETTVAWTGYQDGAFMPACTAMEGHRPGQPIRARHSAKERLTSGSHSSVLFYFKINLKFAFSYGKNR